MHLKIVVRESQACGAAGAPGLPVPGAAAAVWWSKRGRASRRTTVKGATRGRGGHTRPRRELLLTRAPAIRTHWLLTQATSFLPSVRLCRFTGMKSSSGPACGLLLLLKAITTATWAEELPEAAGTLSPRGITPRQKRGTVSMHVFYSCYEWYTWRMAYPTRTSIF